LVAEKIDFEIRNFLHCGIYDTHSVTTTQKVKLSDEN